jgi:hypothetical protein
MILEMNLYLEKGRIMVENMLSRLLGNPYRWYTILFVLVVCSILLGQISHGKPRIQAFPQNRVDQVSDDELQQLKDGIKTDKIQYGELVPGQEERHSLPKRTEKNSMEALWAPADMIIGPGADTVLIDTNYVQDGNILILGFGVLIVDNAVLTLSGSLVAANFGKAIIRNNARLHFDQYYVGQYYIWLVDFGIFEALDATVDANGVMHYANFYDNSTYIARRTYFPDWTFRQVYDKSTMILEDIAHVGDFYARDSSNISLMRCDTLMPWFSAPTGSNMNIQFPDPAYVDHFEISDTIVGIANIGYRVVIDSSSECWWSMDSFPACSVFVNNSTIRGSAQRIPGSDTMSVSGIFNRNLHSDLVIPLSDRHVEYINTYVYWWNWYPEENTFFQIDSCVFGEMIGHEGSTIYGTRSICDGATIHLAALDSAFVTFKDGAVLSFVGAWQKSTLLLNNTVVTPLWTYQSSNVAFGNANLLCVNSQLDSLPRALDTALVMFASIDSPTVADINSNVSIFGSAWLDAGPFNPVLFERYRLFWAPSDSSFWNLISESTNEKSAESLGIWNTTGFSPDDYILRLTIWNTDGDSLTAYKMITLNATGIEEEVVKAPKFKILKAFPNPFEKEILILYELPQEHKIELTVYNLLGSKVRRLVNGVQKEGSYRITWDGKDERNENLKSGIYFLRLKIGESDSFTKKMIFFR